MDIKLDKLSFINLFIWVTIIKILISAVLVLIIEYMEIGNLWSYKDFNFYNEGNKTGPNFFYAIFLEFIKAESLSNPILIILACISSGLIDTFCIYFYSSKYHINRKIIIMYLLFCFHPYFSFYTFRFETIFFGKIACVLFLGQLFFKGKIKYNSYPSLEAQISAISDDIAYNNHDIQDGIKANLFKMEELVEIDFFKNIYKKYKNKITSKNYRIAIYQIIRDSIDLMVRDLLNNTQKNIKMLKVKSSKHVTKSNKLIVCFSNEIKDAEKEIKFFLRNKMYDNRLVLKKNQKGKMIIRKLFKIIRSNPRKFLSKDQLTKDKYRAISDFISGMTDRYAINLYNDNK